MNLET